MRRSATSSAEKNRAESVAGTARVVLSLDLVRGDALGFGALQGGVRNVNLASLMFTYWVRKAQKALGPAVLPSLTLHGLRRTHATLLLEAGESPKVVKELLGHRSQ